MTLEFRQWLVEMAARRSFTRLLGKLSPFASKPTATLTASRADLTNIRTGEPLEPLEAHWQNNFANARLKSQARRMGLSVIPVVGAGQEEDAKGAIQTNKERSIMVQPVGGMEEDKFLDIVKQLLWDPSVESPGGPGPYRHTQWGAMVKLPSQPQAVLLHHQGSPRSPADYSFDSGDEIGSTARPRTNEPNYTQLQYGPRGQPDATDKAGDLGNIKGLPGRRLSMGDPQ